MPGIIDVIELKRYGRELSRQQIFDTVVGFTNGGIPDYQMSAFLMAVTCRGMNLTEAIHLTDAMIATGETLDLSNIPGIKIDKHSTGGVGDKVSLALVPIVASAGITIAKMSGRGLGNTGGTLDKLESITGFHVNQSTLQIFEQVRQIGGCICAQTDSLVPADKKIYALRDVTGTVESVPLIAASIMSKKIAGGADIILLDVKVGRGAFMKSLESANELVDYMSQIGESFGRRVSCELTSMDIPLGQAVGNLIEVKEVADLLRGRKVDERLRQLVIELSDSALFLAGSELSAESLIDSGAAWNKFCQIVAYQGGDIRSIDRWNDVRQVATVRAPKAGFVLDIDASAVGHTAKELGAGRTSKEDVVDPLAGIWIDAVVGSEVQTGSPLARLYGSKEKINEPFTKRLENLFVLSERVGPLRPTMLGVQPAKINN